MSASPLAAAWGGMWRLTARRHFTRGHWLALAATLALLALIFWGYLRGTNGRLEFLAFTVGFHFTFLVPLIAFVGGGGAWGDEMKPEAADYFLNRPPSRAGYLLLRYTAHLLCAQVDFAFALALLIGIALAAHVPGAAAAVPVMLAAQVAGVAAFSAFGFFCAALTPRWVVLGLIYGAIIEVGISHVPLQVNRLAMTEQVRSMLERDSGAAHAWTASLLLVLFAAVWIGAAAVRFASAELAGAKREDL